ncbi:extracellular solute-binding protein [Streptomyces sp. GMY02]|uniref:ABC transporter substrate-binding protein n=1 Tax=Streptomyces sp. GMY02 TaxID=1333528 RepID=UPI001C2BE3A5|nr:extracellular solute-binding protein [Streptomyces sp. GMY02]QXE35782.1 extracellular solute-binding protein [Streptomyces sp. GMY02]
MLSPDRRRFLGTGAAALISTGLVATGLAGCGGDGPTADSYALTVLVPEDGADSVLEAAAERFGRSAAADAAKSSGTPASVELRRVPADAYEAELRASLSSADSPDLLFHWGSGSIRTAAEEYRLIDLYDLMLDNPELGAGFLPAALTGSYVNERPYGVPVRGTRPVLLFYNKALFAGLGLRPPSTWSTLRLVASRVTKAGITPFALGGSDSWTEVMWLAYLVERLGGPDVFRRIQAGDHTGWGDPAVLRAAREVTSLADAGAFGDDFATVSYTEGSATARFARGRAAMHLMDSREHAALVGRFPEFAARHLGWLPFPAVEDGKGDPRNLVGTPAGYLSVSDLTGRGSEAHPGGARRGAALDFLKTFSTPDHTDALLKAGEVPVTADAARRLGASPHPEFTRFQYELVRAAPAFALNWEQAVHPSWRTTLRSEAGNLFAGRSTPLKFTRNLREHRIPAARSR